MAIKYGPESVFLSFSTDSTSGAAFSVGHYLLSLQRAALVPQALVCRGQTGESNEDVMETITTAMVY